MSERLLAHFEHALTGVSLVAPVGGQSTLLHLFRLSNAKQLPHSGPRSLPAREIDFTLYPQVNDTGQMHVETRRETKKSKPRPNWMKSFLEDLKSVGAGKERLAKALNQAMTGIKHGFRESNVLDAWTTTFGPSIFDERPKVDLDFMLKAMPKGYQPTDEQWDLSKEVFPELVKTVKAEGELRAEHFQVWEVLDGESEPTTAQAHGLMERRPEQVATDSLACLATYAPCSLKVAQSPGRRQQMTPPWRSTRPAHQ